MLIMCSFTMLSIILKMKMSEIMTHIQMSYKFINRFTQYIKYYPVLSNQTLPQMHINHYIIYQNTRS